MHAGIKDKSGKTSCQVQTPIESLEHIIAQAENDELIPDISSFDTLTLLKEIRSDYGTSHLSQGKCVDLDNTSQYVHIVSDRNLLSHVIRQMVANAVEASPMGQTVHLGCLTEQNYCTFWVLNEAVMPEFVQAHIFHRNFSAKSQTRGLGTYGIKLLSEKYLKGVVAFTSEINQGTIFRVTFPLEFEPIEE